MDSEMRDPLTGLLHWRALSQLPAPEADTVFLMIDLRGFKPLNDAHGMAVGDRVLAEVGRRITEIVGDSPALRMGGDEFLVVTRLPDETAIQGLAARLRERIEQSIGGIHVRTWAAAGRAAAGDTLATLLRRTDYAMFAVTQNGWTELLIAPPDADEKTVYTRP